MARTKEGIFFLVIGILIPPFVFKGQCDKVKGEEPEYIIFPKAFFSSNADHMKRILSQNVLIENQAMSSHKDSPSSASPVGSQDVQDTTRASSCLELSLTTTESSAGEHWYQWDNSCYKFFYPSKLPWENAVARCRSIRTSADLVFIESEQENREVSRLALEVSGQQPARWWIGLNDIDEENNWKWNNVTVNFTNWRSDEPDNNGAEDCVEFREWENGSALWNDKECDWINHFICEMDVNAAP